jgi:hypothetical protein
MSPAQYVAVWNTGLQGEADAAQLILSIFVVGAFIRLVGRFIRPGTKL